MYGRVFIYYLWLSISTFSKKKKKDEYSINNKTSSKYIYNLNFENQSMFWRIIRRLAFKVFVR